MTETPEERLARLRRELESSWRPPAEDPPDPAPAPHPAEARAVPESPPLTVPGSPPSIATPPPAPAPPRRVDPPPRSRPEAAGDGALEEDGWSLREALGGASLGTWIAIGLVAVGAYLLLSQLVPGLAFPGSVFLAAVGCVLLWLHFTHRAGAWALYAGGVLAAVGSLRVIGGLMPFTVNGETALGVGIAMLAIGYLRHSQAGGYGWQGALGLAALAFGGIQFVLGLLPGSPGILDLVVPAVVLGAGILLLFRTIGARGA